ncbi:hypothetical protein BGW80DRAFT_1255040 [Lactifluus volemus]|nr:hypothetical protein BGW80DRAFT_1255040 [Lactifluus volemus]
MTSQPQVILPSVSDIYSSRDTSRNGPLAQTFATLFEPSQALFEFLVPSVVSTITNPGHHIPHRTYNQTSFLGGHPRIGEIKGLSALSASEQAAHATPPEVLARLSVLNEEYERRSRKDIMVEMEERLEIDETWISGDSKEVHEPGSEAWESAVRRSLKDVGSIAKSRLIALKVDGDLGAAADDD